jgi:hypothetical protein
MPVATRQSARDSTLSSPLASRATIGVRALTAALGAALGLVVAAGLAVFAVHVADGGFYYDDWGVLSVVRFPSVHGGALHGLWLLYGSRPGQVLWYAAFDGTLGFHVHAQLALAASLMALEALCLFVLLRALGMARAGAGAICALVLLFPFSDSLWLWPVLTTNTLTTALYLIGVVLALRALRTAGWRGLALHAVSLSLYLIGIFTYGESFAVVGCLVGASYVYAARVSEPAGRRRDAPAELGPGSSGAPQPKASPMAGTALRGAYARWAVDVVAIVASLLVTRLVLPKDIVTPYPRFSLHHMWLQAGDLVSGAARILAGAAEPYGAPAALLVLGVLGALLLARARDRRWMALAGVGLLVAIAAWAVYVPADYIYSPASPGTGNRVNGLAAIGIAVFLYGAAMLLVRRTWLALALLVALAAGYTYRIAGDARAWDRAAQDQKRVLATIAGRVPRPPHGASFFVADWPSSAAPGVPVYGEPYYLSSALKWKFSDRTLSGAQVERSTKITCGSRAVTASRLPYASPLTAGYGRAYLVDVRADRVVALSGPRQCSQTLR